MADTVVINVPDEAYAKSLRVLGAWWCLGSSAIDPVLLMRCVPAQLPSPREAGF
jgi:hypothetical protein